MPYRNLGAANYVSLIPTGWNVNGAAGPRAKYDSKSELIGTRRGANPIAEHVRVMTFLATRISRYIAAMINLRLLSAGSESMKFKQSCAGNCRMQSSSRARTDFDPVKEFVMVSCNRDRTRSPITIKDERNETSQTLLSSFECGR